MEQLSSTGKKKKNGSRQTGEVTQKKSTELVMNFAFLPYLVAGNQKQSEPWNCTLGTEEL